MWSISFLLYAAAAALGTYYITSTFYQWYRLRHVPGPFLAGFSYLWLLFVAPSGREPYVYWDLANKHGHLVRTGPNVVITDDPEVLRRTGATRGSSGRYGKDGFYLAVLQHPDHKNMFATMDVAAHDEKKAKLLGAYSGRETDAMEPLVDGFVDELVRYLRRKISHSVNAETCRSASVTVELGRTVQYFTLDVITRVAFGKELGYLQTDSDVHNLVEMVTATATAFTIIISIPWIRSIATSDIFKKYFGPKSTDPTGLGVIIRTCEGAVKERYQPGAPEENDLLGAFIRCGLDQGSCLSEMMFTLGAGSDSTASTIRATLLYIISTPRVYFKLKEVILEAVRKGRASSPIRQAEAKGLPYLQAVLYEGLRMRPPFPVMFSKSVPPQGDVIDGKFIPGGTAIGMNLLPMMRSTESFGHDSDIFRPERFLEADVKSRSAMERIVELSFGTGRWMCAGKPLAFMELNKVYFELFRHFDFQLVNPTKPWNSKFVSLWMDNDFFVRVSETSTEK